MKTRLASTLATALFFISPLRIHAEGTTEMVITPNRIDAPRSSIGTSLTVISAEDIASRNVSSLAEMLRTAVGVDVVQNGPLGGNTAVFLRGANPEHTLILLDGVELNNPISPGRVANIADLPLSQIARIEILKGPQSTLYGSDALGGVINIITAKGEGEPLTFASVEGGSFNTWRETAAVRGGDHEFDYALTAGHRYSDGISAATSRLGNSEEDGYQAFDGSLNVGWNPLSELSVRGIVRGTSSASEIDDLGGLGEDSNRHIKNRELASKLQVDISALDQRSKHSFYLHYANHALTDFDGSDARTPFEMLNATYDGDLTTLGLQNVVSLTSHSHLLIGAETKNERGSSSYLSDGIFGPFSDIFDDHSQRTNSVFTQLGLSELGGLSATAGIRTDSIVNQNSKTTWKIAPVYLIESTGTKLSSSVGTGFKAPSLYQRYSSYGTPTLLPERSLGIDAGVTQELSREGSHISATYFWNRYRSLISFDSNTFKYFNVARAKTEGMELAGVAVISSQFSLFGSATYTEARDEETDESLFRRPRKKGTIALRYKNEGLLIESGIRLVGKSFDNDFSTFPATKTVLAGHGTAYLSSRYELSPCTRLTARVENLLDKNYEEVLGYGTYGIGGFIGIEGTW